MPMPIYLNTNQWLLCAKHSITSPNEYLQDESQLVKDYNRLASLLFEKLNVLPKQKIFT